jgi:galactose-1-phosphate uridylyltransferase
LKEHTHGSRKIDGSNTNLTFKNHARIGKPVTITKKEMACPFCLVNDLTEIIATEGSIIWLKNKFPTLENTLQSVIIETDEYIGLKSV